MVCDQSPVLKYGAFFFLMLCQNCGYLDVVTNQILIGHFVIGMGVVEAQDITGFYAISSVRWRS